jgi:hypothetical protein
VAGAAGFITFFAGLGITFFGQGFTLFAALSVPFVILAFDAFAFWGLWAGNGDTCGEQADQKD